MIHELLIQQSLYSTYSAINKNGEGELSVRVQSKLLETTWD
ncbi:hypothetical protein SynRS9902_02265 [Synechococcus sp. RS9902]|nr:hypothetical protein SynRS9902_02265 [Synechococcus sp. RS9902]